MIEGKLSPGKNLRSIEWGVDRRFWFVLVALVLAYYDHSYLAVAAAFVAGTGFYITREFFTPEESERIRQVTEVVNQDVLDKIANRKYFQNLLDKANRKA